MTNEIISKQLYFHPLSDVGFSTQEAATQSYEKIIRAKKRAEEKAAKSKKLRDYVRLNLESISDLEEMLSKNIEDVFGYVFNLRISNLYFGEVSCSHGAPIGKKTNWCGRDKGQPTSYLGWTGSISGKYYKDKTISECFGNFAYNGINGFHTGSGGGGGKSWSYEFYFFLEDFPKLTQKYKKYNAYREKLEEEINREQIAQNQWKIENEKIYQNDPVVIKNIEQITRLEKEIKDIQACNLTIRNQINKENPFKFKKVLTTQNCKNLIVDFS